MLSAFFSPQYHHSKWLTLDLLLLLWLMLLMPITGYSKLLQSCAIFCSCFNNRLNNGPLDGQNIFLELRPRLVSIAPWSLWCWLIRYALWQTQISSRNWCIYSEVIWHLKIKQVGPIYVIICVLDAPELIVGFRSNRNYYLCSPSYHGLFCLDSWLI